ARFCGGEWLRNKIPRIGVPFSSINDSRLYSVLDVLRTHKDKLCACLHEHYRSCSVVESEFLLYDVASRYFDCLRESASAIWCPPKSQLKPSRGNSSPAGLGPSAAPVWKVKLVAHPDGAEGEQYLLFRSSARRQKKLSMLDRQRERLPSHPDKNPRQPAAPARERSGARPTSKTANGYKNSIPLGCCELRFVPKPGCAWYRGDGNEHFARYCCRGTRLHRAGKAETSSPQEIAKALAGALLRGTSLGPKECVERRRPSTPVPINWPA
ncbi:MAG TPA: hypothetical protein VIT21_12560, partial [Chthoniobacterales bacterium]